MLIICVQCHTPRPLNVLFILVDDLGARDLACYGSTFHETPHLDQLARENIQFQQAYAAHPVCSPTRAAIMTGKYPHRLGITDWIPGQDPQDRLLRGPQDADHLDLSEWTLAELFKENGYHTFFAGKWHLGSEGYLPTDQGFDINKGGHHKGSPPGGYYSPYKNPMLSDGPVDEYLPDRLTSETIEFMSDHRDDPFFAYLSFYTVHTPIQASKSHIEHYQKKKDLLSVDTVTQVVEGDGMTNLNQVNAAYASMVAAMDEQVGRLIDWLKRERLWDNTLLVFTSDNGGLSTLAGKRVAPTSIYPLRAGKGWCYEGGIRVPLLVHHPERSAAVIKDPVISVDFFATLAEELQLSSVNQSPSQTDGINILKTESEERSLIWHYPHYHGSAWKPGSAIRKGKWKLIYWYETQSYELYDLDSDEEEQVNVASQQSTLGRSLQTELFTHLAERTAQMPTKNPLWNAPKN